MALPLDLSSPYPKISDYGAIGNGRTAALISHEGSLEWACFPHFDSDSYFAALLDRRRGGFFQILPMGFTRSEQAYLEDTNVLRTVFTTSGGKLELLDTFSVTTQRESRQRLWPDAEILRIAECTQGKVRVRMTYAPRPHYAQYPHHIEARGRLGFYTPCGHDVLILRTDLPEGAVTIQEGENGQDAVAEVDLAEGQRFAFSLIYSSEAPAILPALGPWAQERMAASIQYWRAWAGQCQYTGPYQRQVRRSALALKLLTFAPSGAIVAAPTASLPEWIGGVRNWDYRFCWLRDASFTMRALMELGYYDEAVAFVNWMLDTGASHKRDFQILYTLWGEPRVPEKRLDWLEGYMGSRPVRIGNAAEKQFQLDVYGEVIDAIYFMASRYKRFPSEMRSLVLSMGKTVCEKWDEPDDGIWEVRTRPRHYTHSRVMAWVALDRLLKLSHQLRWRHKLIDLFESTRSRIRDAIENRGYHQGMQAYARSFGSTEMDASVLVMPLVDYCPADSPRMMSTIRRIQEKLLKDGLVHRYSDSVDGIPGTEGAFGVCTFWLIDCLSKAGRIQEARSLFESFLRRSNSVGLWPEEIDATTGAFLGNYPQGFTHIGLINSAITLEQEIRNAKEKAA